MKKNIAIVAGGDSGEYEISISSAAVVSRHIDKLLYESFIIEIKGTEWVYRPEAGGIISIDKNDFSLMLHKRKINFDCVFIAIHGTPGENGLLQGYFELLGIPYTSCDLTTSSITFNKYFCNKLVSSFGIQVANSFIVRKKDISVNSEISSEIGFPCFVKPNSGGSSVGITKVLEQEDLMPAILKAFEEDDQVLIEAFIPGREITCGVIRVDGQAKALPLTEVVSRNEFFDYEAKYTEGMAEEITPAPVSEDIEKACKQTSLMLYEQLNCKGIVRFDYIINEGGMYFLEVNTVPGLSAASIVPKQAEMAGISLKSLFSLAIQDALKNR